MHGVQVTVRRSSVILAAVVPVVALAAGIAAAPAAAAPARQAAVGRDAAPGRLAVPAFNFGWKQAPANASLSGISCLSASDCVAVGSYTDVLGHQHSSAQLWNGSSWRVLANVPGTGLAGVSCTRASFCIAVGSVIDQWTGKGWKELAGPPGSSGSLLRGVSCVTASFCMAVGTDGSGEANVAEQWDGRSWRSLKTPGNGCVPFCGMSDVACPSARDCVAVGGTASDSDLADFSSGMAWNGKSWRNTATPAPGGNSSLSGVSCTSAASCLAVGNYGSEVPSCNCVLAASWNGSAWTQVSPPSLAGNLTGVSCRAARSCVAVGGPLAATWTGTTWKQQTIAAPGEAGTQLSDIACWSTSGCLAAGSYTEYSGARLTLAERWNGTTWSVARTRSPADPFAGLSGVSCESAARCVAVGTYVTRSDTLATLAEKWNGGSWSVQPTPNPPGSKVSALTGVSCPTATGCMAVGSADTAGPVAQTLAEKWDGSSWQVVPTSHAGTLTAVSCPTSLSCIAVGSYFDPHGSRLPLAESWNGTTWQVLPLTGPGATLTRLTGIACTGPSNCVAVGAYNTSLTSPLRPLTERWNGSAWAVLANPGGSRQLAAVSCPRHASCMAAGSDLVSSGPHLPTVTTAMAWNGTTWRVSRTATPRGRARAYLGGVACAATTRCQAAGGSVRASGSVAPLAESWNGAAWVLRPVSAPSPAFNDLYGISCFEMTRCVAVGVTGAQQTLAETWNGARWQLTKTLNP